MSLTETAAVLLDGEHLNRFRDNPKGLRELIDAFLVTTEPILDELERASQRRNEPEFRHLLHALSGAARSAGARALADGCEALVHRRESERRLAGIRELGACFRQTREILTTFSSELPADPAPAARPDAARKTLLLVEDNATARELLHAMLAGEYRLLDAENGATALALCASEIWPDAAIVDLNLGRSESNSPSGLDVIQRIGGRFPAIVLTVDRSRDSVRAAVRAGAWAYLIKPPDPIVLHATLEAALARSNGANDRSARDVLNIATGLLMADHHLDEPEARQLIVTLAAAQRRKATDLAEDVIAAQGLRNTLTRAAQRLPEPTDGPPS